MMILKNTLIGIIVLFMSVISSTAHAQFFDIQSATGTGSHNIYQPSRVIDGGLRFPSLWVGNGSPEELILDIGSNQRLDDVQIAWGGGTTRTYTFEIAARSGTNGTWTTIFSGTSRGNTNGFENYNVDDITAQQVRIRGLSNSSGTAFTSIREVTISGTGGQTDTSLPLDDTHADELPDDTLFYDIQTATAVGSHPTYDPLRAIDGELGFPSLWYGNGSPEELVLDLGSDQKVQDVQIAWGAGLTRRYEFEVAGRSGDSGAWTTIFEGTSRGDTSGFENYNVTDIEAQQIRIRGLSNSSGTAFTSIREVTLSGTSGENEFGLDPNAEPWENFDLLGWVIDTPAFASDGESERFGENNWDDISDASRDFFLTHSDGGMRFISTVGGARTSQNTSFVRSELREMLRRGNTRFSTQGVTGNNWALGYQPGSNTNHGGRNGVLKATLRVNEVTSTGSGTHPGRVIIGQIHADNDEPARLYYRKLPEAEFGCIYVSHEIRDGDDIDFDLIGDEQCRDNGPANGIRLNQLFSYEIINENENIRVVIRQGDADGPIVAETTIDMNALNSGYDRLDEWMYFKAGAYTQNNTGDDSDRDVVTFYRLSNTHDNN